MLPCFRINDRVISANSVSLEGVDYATAVQVSYKCCILLPIVPTKVLNVYERNKLLQATNIYYWEGLGPQTPSVLKLQITRCILLLPQISDINLGLLPRCCVILVTPSILWSREELCCHLHLNLKLSRCLSTKTKRKKVGHHTLSVISHNFTFLFHTRKCKLIILWVTS